MYNKNLALEMLSEYSEIINKEFEKKYGFIEDADAPVRKLYDAQRYSLCAGGKRIRPALALEVCRLFSGEYTAAIPFAVALEMIHTYSLIHDDLPCMDDDDLRRGKPTNHKVYGEDYAILAGDGLLSDAFLECAMNPYVSGDCAAAAVGILSSACGSFGMVKGQAMDMYGEEVKLTLEELCELHRCKTGAMICASCELGVLAAGILPNDEKMQRVAAFAEKIGLAFQIIDDVLDATSTVEVLGKGVMSDGDKTTFMTYFSPEKAYELAQKYTLDAIEDIKNYEGSERLCALAEYLLERKA